MLPLEFSFSLPQLDSKTRFSFSFSLPQIDSGTRFELLSLVSSLLVRMVKNYDLSGNKKAAPTVAEWAKLLSLPLLQRYGKEEREKRKRKIV